MRKLDVLILKSFVGPFILTTVVSTFILLIQYLLKYFDDFVGKNLGFEVFAELIFYFSLNMLRAALPLGVLVSSLMTFGNLGENFELTAIKGAGISLLRALRPIFFFVVVLTVAAFFFNNHVVPAANLKAYSLLYDIKHKKPALDIKQGVFYNGIPDYSIKVKEKLPDNTTLKDVLIYDHTEGQGNKRVILADSSRMYTMFNEKYLKLELYNGNYYSEESKAREPVDQFYRTKFKRMDMVFSLSSFDLKRTKEELFQNNRQMKNISELNLDIDSLQYSIYESKEGFVINAKSFFQYHLDSLDIKIPKKFNQDNIDKLKKPVSPEQEQFKQEASASMIPLIFQKQPPQSAQDKKLQTPIEQLPKEIKLKSSPLDTTQTSLEKQLDLIRPETLKLEDKTKKPEVKLDTLSWDYLNEKLSSRKSDILQTAKNQSQNIKVNLTSIHSRVYNLQRNLRKWEIAKHKMYAMAFACIVMFLIGAPLGAIIKKGGLGVPVIISILFFLTYYIINITCEKWAREGLMDTMLAVWMGDLLLLPFGFFFLRQARIDARLFDTDFYNIWIDKIKTKIAKR